MMSLTGMRGLSEPTGSWKMICIRRRMRLRSRPLSAGTSRPSNVTAAGRGLEAEDESAEGRLAAAGLADEPERLAPVDVEGDIVHGVDVAHLRRRMPP